MNNPLRACGAYDMSRQPALALRQLAFLRYELQLMNNTCWWRWVSCWFSKSFLAIAVYRLDRFCYLSFGRSWRIIRVLLTPLFFLFRPWLGSCEIHYLADIGRGLKILHPSLGVVISGYAIIGQDCTLTGGNCIGGRENMAYCQLFVGDNVTLGANAVVLGPVRLGNNIKVGAGAVVIHDAADNDVLVGVPAHSIKASVSSNI
jgi:serine O-acetyltransferase